MRIKNYAELAAALARGEKVYSLSGYWRKWDEVLQLGANNRDVQVQEMGTKAVRYHSTNLFGEGDIVQTDVPGPKGWDVVQA